MRKFDLLIESLSHEDKIGHLFILDIKFKEEKENEKIFFSIKFPLQYLKKKNIWVLQAICFSTLMKKNSEGSLNSYRYNIIRKADTTITNIFFSSTLCRTYSFCTQKSKLDSNKNTHVLHL